MTQYFLPNGWVKNYPIFFHPMVGLKMFQYFQYFLPIGWVKKWPNIFFTQLLG